MKTFKRILIVRANGDCRVVSNRRRNRLRLDEVGFDLHITIPETWGKMQGLIDVKLPDPPTPEAIVKILTEEAD